MAELIDNNQRRIEVTAKDLPLHCPMPNMRLWDSHPRVFLPIEETGEARCPYCGTLYVLNGPLPHGHH
ncbi:zinc-finger domain-containing protein [Parachitinimonas caeni]|uniref:Zinc-finger domain-containing protein n=1 Tax=Parachitinimonas caeni TaxID=3031301 RepID=A0ABT7DWK3_9NEIS|nr:zinc-finger domain-containing protein [Parachitinimonas caeni]MDK2124364.1 zinc-finger domain-containing protein [Parachitinimonas caeni]